MVRVPAPMLATAGRPPDPTGPWAVEMKWDGMRAIAVTDEERARFYSRTGREVTMSFPDAAQALLEITAGRRMIIDGEIIAPELPTGTPSFTRLQHRMHIRRPR